MSKQQADEPQPLWRGHPLYVSPDGRFSTIDKERYDQYMAAAAAQEAREARLAARRGTVATPESSETTSDEGVTDAATDVDQDEQPTTKSNRRRRGDDDRG